MKRYLLFAGSNHYPDGGWEDFKGSFDSVDEAKNDLLSRLLGDSTFDWYHIVDTETQEIVAKDSHGS